MGYLLLKEETARLLETGDQLLNHFKDVWAEINEQKDEISAFLNACETL